MSVESTLIIKIGGLALLTVVLNDCWTQRLAKNYKRQGHEPPARLEPFKTHWGKVAWLAAGLALAAYAFGLPGKEAKRLDWLTMFACVCIGVSVVLFLVARRRTRLFIRVPRFLITLFYPSLRGDKVIWLENGGSAKCPRCAGVIHFQPKKQGETAFTCENCGEKGTWE